MQGSAWLDLLRRIPADLQDCLTLGLVTGAEVVVQQILKLEDNLVVVRGRMAGTTAEGRVLMVPYSHMALVGFNKRMNDVELQALLGAPVPPAPVVVETAAAPEAAAPESQPEAPTAATAATQLSLAQNPLLPASPNGKKSAPGLSASKSKPPSKSMLLARLRERLAEKAK